MIRVPLVVDPDYTVETSYAHVASVARLPYVRYRERDGQAYAVRYIPALGKALVYTAPIPGGA